MSVDVERLGQRLLKSLGDAAHIVRGLDALREHPELVATKPSEYVARTKVRVQSLRDRLQEAIACDVAVRVVDQLEPIEVDEQHGITRCAGSASSA